MILLFFQVRNTTLYSHRSLLFSFSIPHLEVGLNRLLLLSTQAGGHHDRDGNVQISLLTGELVDGHSLSLNLQHLTGLGDGLLAEIHTVTIQMVNVMTPAEQSLLQRNAVINTKIVVVASEQAVLALLQHHNHVTRVQLGMLVSLVLEGDLLSILHTTLNIHRHGMRLGDELVTMADTALLIKGLTLSTTFLAGLLNLLHKARSQLNTLVDNSASLTHRTSVHMVGVICSRTVAVRANLLAVEGEGVLTSVVQILQSDGNRRLHILVTLLSAKVTESEEISEGVEALLLISLLSLLDTLLTLYIVDTSLIVIRETLISGTDVVPLFFALVRLTLIRMVFEGQLSVGLFNFAARSISTRHLLKITQSTLTRPGWRKSHDQQYKHRKEG